MEAKAAAWAKPEVRARHKEAMNTPETKKKLRARPKHGLNRVWINDGVNEKAIKDTDSIPEGWSLGRIAFRNRVWVNNGVKSLMVPADAIPPGFTRGRLPFR